MDETPQPDPDEGFARLESAMNIWARFVEGLEGESPAALLARHDELRDLLEPMFAADDRTKLLGVDDSGEGSGDGGEGDDGGSGGLKIGSGQILGGDFRLRGELGRGGMGVVFEAHQLSLDRLVAVKILPAGQALSSQATARFRREALTSARLEHKSIVQVYGTGEDDGIYWFAMERITGEPLDEYVEHHHCTASERDVQRIVELVAAIADALHHAHEAGVIHRDVKPSNILVRADGTPVLTDFGLAREEGLPSLSHSGTFAGTPYYVSPEQATRTAEPVDARTDIFSLGVTLYELLTSERPFRGDTTGEVIAAILHRNPLDPQKVNPDLHHDLCAIVLKALEKVPADRYATAEEFASDMRRFLAYRPVKARRASTLRRARRWVQREPLKAALVGVLAIAIPTVVLLVRQVLQENRAAELGQEELTRQTVASLMLEASRAKFQQDLDGAERAYQAARQLAPEHPLPIAELALHDCRLTREGKMFRPERALELLDANSETVGRYNGLRRIRAMILRELGRAEEADAITSELGEPRSAMEYLVIACQGLAQVERGDTSALEPSHRALISAMLRSPEPNPAHYTRLFVTANLIGDAELEKAVADALVDLWPQSPASWIFMTMYWYGRDDEKTLEMAHRCLEVLPDYYWAHWKVGEMKDRAGDLEGAIASYKAAWRAFEGDGKVAHSLGGALARKGELTQALEFFKQAALKHSADPEMWQSLGDVLVELERPDDVMKVATHMHATWPESPVGQWLIADSRALENKAEEAVLLYEHAIERAPKEAAGHGRIARLLLDDGRWSSGDRSLRAERARTAAREAVSLSRREDAEYLCYLAEAEFRKGDKSAALRLANEALALVRDSEPTLKKRVLAAAARYR